VQAGVNGKQELTYRRVLEDDTEISRSMVKSVILQEALPEIVMVGAQTSFAPLPCPANWRIWRAATPGSSTHPQPTALHSSQPVTLTDASSSSHRTAVF
jgi:hypothetical protein